MSNMTSSSSRAPLRVLCLHGLTENADIMKKKLDPITQRLPRDDFEFVFLSAPYILPEIGQLKTSQNNLNLKANGSKEKEEKDPKQKKKEIQAYFATSYHRATQGYSYSESQRQNPRQVKELDQLRVKYDAMLDKIEPLLRNKAEGELYNLQGQGRRWWTLPDEAKEARKPTFIGQEASFAVISQAMKEYGPFDGLIGFSTGAMMGNFCQALLSGSSLKLEEPSFQPPNNQRPFKFTISFAPWLVTDGTHLEFIKEQEDNKSTSVPSLVFEGTKDRFCRKGTCQKFADATSAERYELHNGGHSIPFWENYSSFTAEWLSLVGRQLRGELNFEQGTRLRKQLPSPYHPQESQRPSARL